MGGCMSSVMEWRSSQSVHVHPIIADFCAYGQEADALPGTETPTCSAIYRFANTSDAEQAELCHKHYYGKHWVERVESRARVSADLPAMGYRVIESIEKREVADPTNGQKKIFNYYHCSPHKLITYGEMWSKMLAFGRGLTALLRLKAGATVSIYEETRWEWMVSIYGIWTQRMVASTVYANLGEDALRYALRETDSEAIICNGSQVGMLTKVLSQEGLSPVVIALDDVPVNTPTHDLHVVAWTDVVATGEEVSAEVPVYTTTESDDVALIMYTSGTTGDPKGVVHTHGSIAAGCEALNHRIMDLYTPGGNGEIYCAYLPLAHILEFAVVNIFFDRGTLVGFGTPRTLTDAYAVPHGDLKEFQPKMILSVPRIFDTIRKTVEGRLPPPGSIKRDIYDRAYESRRTALLEAKDTPYWNDKAFSAPRAVLGGGVYGMLSGGGPLSPSTQEFINVVCGGPLILQGWGLTETVCCGATQRLGDMEPNCVGQLVKTCEMRLQDVDSYTHTDQPEPRGEICLRGPFMFKEYYKQPALTKEAFDAEGWFHTGDVGSISKLGKLRIVGRVKALAKNCLGEYIALETLEAIYSQNELCAVNGVCVVVHPEKPYVAALVLADPKRALSFAKEHSIAGSFEELTKNPAFHKAAAASLALTARAAGRQSFELVKNVRVLADEWTPENGLLTPTLKLRRGNVESRYTRIISELFKD
ncbi:putative mitochondrial fatty acyl CoA synthetase 2 [Leptomonas pyrrhocoris]|uniref:Putative mitochondrial fatty acyl CoA synthetase 2 n=1 Tax=Leptomonas pyrrhocoris TaxID=157538 RepID=A0A0N0VCW6_LEPPY|nr:putative mitochondrial fatty acyl CoA synthetase 2 [Leptomonas pyrrhocoris]XP_015652148.1 putative mitochondrial fatty acyl CoA synthetase 2 [Leptomonas pyrrhocoris]KPA73708.1 putative mitochondrial fatty acyl CoA synthetase 2 [Leptomonas pyrrhocoris]KPA73709.1 putative mitochondrial fatty acyl CoA synthetase 2 [Leptomonas pyrrhocoris]|eukprot:XP_015652147.1 putative mitochondrial fatty acyl CoA synthetase 2 [Leptomonas pyrrhocoris]